MRVLGRLFRWVLGLICVPFIVVIGLGVWLRGVYLKRKDRSKNYELQSSSKDQC